MAPRSATSQPLEGTAEIIEWSQRSHGESGAFRENSDAEKKNKIRPRAPDSPTPLPQTTNSEPESLEAQSGRRPSIDLKDLGEVENPIIRASDIQVPARLRRNPDPRPRSPPPALPEAVQIPPCEMPFLCEIRGPNCMGFVGARPCPGPLHGDNHEPYYICQACHHLDTNFVRRNAVAIQVVRDLTAAIPKVWTCAPHASAIESNFCALERRGLVLGLAQTPNTIEGLGTGSVNGIVRCECSDVIRAAQWCVDCIKTLPDCAKEYGKKEVGEVDPISGRRQQDASEPISQFARPIGRDSEFTIMPCAVKGCPRVKHWRQSAGELLNVEFGKTVRWCSCGGVISASQTIKIRDYDDE